MIGDPIDLNEQDVGLVEAHLLQPLRQNIHDLAASVQKILRSQFRSYAPEGEAVTLGDVARDLQHFVSNLPEQLPLRAETVRQLNAVIKDAVGLGGQMVGAFRKALEHWRLDVMQDGGFETLSTLMDQLKGMLVDEGRALFTLNKVLQSERIQVLGASVFRRALSYLGISRSVLDLSTMYGLKSDLDALGQDLSRRRQEFADYRRQLAKANKGLAKFASKPYQIFLALPPPVQERLKEVYLLAKVHETNDQERKIPDEALAAVLKRRLVLSAIIPAFDSYYAALDQALFEESRLLKDEASAGKLDSEAGRATVEFWLEERRHETQMLKFLVYRVREFFLRNDPNPYVHTRMGWHDRPLGPEPKQTAPLSRLRRSLRRLDGLFHRLSEAVHEFERSKSDAKWQRNILVVGELYEGINELSQLESKEEALQHVDELMSCWRQIDEVCSFHSEDVSYDEFLLRKALLNDRFFVLVKHQAFQDMYRMHIAIRGPFREQSQREKITRIQAVLRQWRNSAEQVGEVLTESNAFLDGLWRTSESSDTAEFEEARRQFLEFLNSYHRFELFAQRIVVPRSIDRQWTEVNQRIHDLDHRFFLIEQQSLLALRVG